MSFFSTIIIKKESIQQVMGELTLLALIINWVWWLIFVILLKTLFKKDKGYFWFFTVSLPILISWFIWDLSKTAEILGLIFSILVTGIFLGSVIWVVLKEKAQKKQI